jgi:hypothetical protein
LFSTSTGVLSAVYGERKVADKKIQAGKEIKSAHRMGYIYTYIYISLLTYSMEQSPSSKLTVCS